MTSGTMKGRHSRGGRLPAEIRHRAGTTRPGLAQRADVRLDHGRHLILGEAAISERAARTWPTVCDGDSAESGVLVVRSGRQSVAAGEHGGTCVSVFASCPRSAVGLFPHQRHGERANGLGGAKRSIVVSAFVSDSSEPPVSVAAGESSAGGKIRRSRCTRSTEPPTR